MSIRAARFVRSLALVGASTSFGCGGASTQPVVAVPPPATTTNANTASNNTSTSPTGTSIDAPPTGVDGQCRCSWDTNAASAPRVCKRTESNYEGTSCQPQSPYSPQYGGYRGRRSYPMPGPLPPPDLAV